MPQNPDNPSRISRRALFTLSLLLGVAAYAGLFVAAPYVTLLRPNNVAPEIIQTFEVELAEPESTPRYRTVESETDSTSRPNTVQELLEEELESAPPALPERPAISTPIPRLDERLAQETIAREYDFTEATAEVTTIDAKILEISQEAARMDLEIPRRLVRPSSMRVLEPDELPALRKPGVEEFAIARTLPSLPAATQEPQIEGAGLGDLLEPMTPIDDRPPFEEGVLNQEFAEAEGLPELPAELLVARAPVQEEIRRESPYEFIDDLVQIDLDAYVPPGQPRGFFRVRIAPRDAKSLDVLPKDVTFVIDASSSIMQRKLDLTTRGLEQCLALLRPEDRFNIVIFRDTAQPFRTSPAAATPAEKAAALQFISGLQSGGETDVYNGVKPVLDLTPREGMASVVMVMSDGRSTAGPREARDIINGLTEGNTQRNSVYAFGGGRTVNRYLLDLLAYRNKGESFVAPNLDDIDQSLPRFFQRVNDPVLVDLSADYGRITDTEVYPKELPDFYRGRVVEIFGQFDPKRDNEFVMRLEGVAGHGQKELVYKADLAKAQTADESIARLWAFQKIYYLIGEICRVGEDPKLLAEVRELSQRYNIETSYSR